MAILIKQSELGTTHPFVARMFVGIIEIRDLIIMTSIDPRNKKIKSSHFDKYYEPIRRSMETLLHTASAINLLLTNYQNKIDNGEIIKFNGDNIEVLRTIDFELNKEFGNLLNLSIIVSKSCLQKFLNIIYDLDIGFLFQAEDSFNKGIQKLLQTRKTDLSDYLIQTRQNWSSEANQLRINREHNNWLLDKIEYIGKPPVLHINFPQINKTPVNEYSRKLANRTIRFVEDMIAYGFQDIGFSPIKLIEIREVRRERSCPKRFLAVPSTKNDNHWKIKYQENFDFL